QPSFRGAADSHCGYRPARLAVSGVLMPPRPTSPTFFPSLEREIELRLLGYNRIAGVDEAGRGPLAGPVVAGAVILPADFPVAEYSRLTDSKKLTAAAREKLFARITGAFEFGVGIVDAKTIDEINIRQASWLAMQRAVADLQAPVVASGVL